MGGTPVEGGTLPSNIGSLTNLEILELDNCHLRGPVPSELGFLSKLTGSFLKLSVHVAMSRQFLTLHCLC